MQDNEYDSSLAQAQKTVTDHVVAGLQAFGFTEQQATGLVKYFGSVITAGVPPTPPGGGGGD